MNLTDKIASDKLTLVNFHATWCGPCHAMKPHLDEVVAKLGDEIHYERVDIDQHPELTRELQIRGVPTTMLFRNGEMKWRHSGVYPAHELGKVIDEHL